MKEDDHKMMNLVTINDDNKVEHNTMMNMDKNFNINITLN